MSGDGFSEKEQEARQKMAQAVKQRLASGRTPEDVVREFEAKGWSRDDAVEFVRQVEQKRPRTARSSEAQAADYIESRFPEMRPIGSGPALTTLNGCGLTLCGARDRDPETGTYVKTWAICLAFVPLLPLRAYRVAKARGGGGWHILGRVPLSTFAKAWNLLIVGAVVALIGSGIWSSYANSDAAKAKRKLAEADEAVASGDLATAAQLYSQVATGRTDHAATAKESLEELLSSPALAEMSAAETVRVFRGVAIAARSVPGVFQHGIEFVRKHASDSPVEAAELFQTIALLSPKEARAALTELLDGPFRDLSAQDTEGVARMIAEVRQLPVLRESLAAWVTDWPQRHPEADPRETLSLLDFLEESFSADPADADPAGLEATRCRLWEQILADDPKDFEAAVELALLLESQGNDERIETLLLPHADKLGSSEGARLLGQLLAARGEFEQSYALLQPYLQERLAKLHDASEAFDEAITDAQDRVIEMLRDGSAPGFNFRAYDNATEDRQETMVDDYLSKQIQKDPTVTAAQAELIRHANVMHAALDLGMVMLRRAETMPDADARQAELKKAEETFLAIQGIAGDTDEYRLHLGQVYYWLGKHEEGHELFEELLASHQRAYEILIAVAQVVRELGEVGEARQLFEEAYHAVVDDQQRHNAAYMRALTSTDRQDKITWLERANQDSPEVRASLCCARGDQATAEGDDRRAAQRYREAVAIYDRMAETDAALNNGALAYLSLFGVTGDPKVLDKGIQWLEKAIALAPGEPIVLANAALALYPVTIQDLAGGRLDLNALEGLGSIEVLQALAADQQQLDQLRRDARNHASLVKATSYFDKAMLLAPKNLGLYGHALRLHAFVRDAEALERLSRRIETAAPDPAELVAWRLEFCRFEEDQANLDEAALQLDKWNTLVKKYRRGAKGPGFAVAVGNLMESQLAQWDLSSVDADELVQLAEEAHQAAPSLTTYELLGEALLFRASRTLEASVSEYAKAIEGIHRSLPASYTVVLAMARDDRLGKSAGENPDVQRVAELVLKQHEVFPDSVGPRIWALLRATHPDRAKECGQTIVDDQVERLSRKISLQMCPVATTVACSEYWARLAAGDDEPTARIPLQRAADLGVPIPLKLLDRNGAN